MAHMVFIRQIDPKSFLHFTVKETAFCLRVYPSPSAPPREVRRQSNGCYAQNIFELADQPGNIRLNAPAVPYSDSRFWYDHIRKLNNEYQQIVQPLAPTETEVFRQPPPPGGDTEDMKVEIKAGGEIIGVLKVSKSTITWYPRGEQAGYRLSWAKFGGLMQLHGEAASM